MNFVLLGGGCGAVAGLIAGSLYAVFTQEYSIIEAGLLGLAFGILPGGFYGFRYRATTQAASISSWVQWYLFLGLIAIIPLACVLGLAALFGLAGASDYQPVSEFILAIGMLVLAGGGSGAAGGLVGGLLFKQFLKIR